VPKLHVPPATLQVEVRPNMDYTDLPRIVRFRSTMSIANGLSAPKIITAVGGDGKYYKQLVGVFNDTQIHPLILYSSNLAMMTFVKTRSWSRSLTKSPDC
jgi:hypothetical protein